MHKLFDIICKPPLIAARMGLLFVMTLCVMLPCHAQDGLAVNGIFQQYGHSKGCKMVVMHNTKLRGYQLAIYKSLTYNNKYAASINNILKTDRGKGAVIYIEGDLSPDDIMSICYTKR